MTYFEVRRYRDPHTILYSLFNIAKNLIDGLEFEDLKAEDMFKMIPAVGIAKKIIRLLPGGNVST